MVKVNNEANSEIKILEVWNRPTVFLEVEDVRICNFDVMGLVQGVGETYFERPESMEVYVCVHRIEGVSLE